MSSLGTDIISALWKGPKVAMLVIGESTLAEPKNANHCSSSTRRTGAIPKDALGNQYDFFPLAGVLGLRTIPAYPNDLPVVPGLALILCEPPVRVTRRPVGTTCRAFLRDPTLCQVGVRKMCKSTCRAPLLPVVTSAKASVDRSRSSGMDVSESEPCIGRAFRKSQISRHGRYSFW
jgi:hypothetical protein